MWDYSHLYIYFLLLYFFSVKKLLKNIQFSEFFKKSFNSFATNWCLSCFFDKVFHNFLIASIG